MKFPPNTRLYVKREIFNRRWRRCYFAVPEQKADDGALWNDFWRKPEPCETGERQRGIEKENKDATEEIERKKIASDIVGARYLSH